VHPIKNGIANSVELYMSIILFKNGIANSVVELYILYLSLSFCSSFSQQSSFIEVFVSDFFYFFIQDLIGE
jgi:hypothetical protein